jgi:hypothetical protein
VDAREQEASVRLSAASTPTGEARTCPTCRGDMIAVVRAVYCPCDAPWCANETRQIVCPTCTPKD